MNEHLLLAAVVLLIVFWSVGAVKRFKRQRSQCQSVFVQVYAQLRQRYEIIPPLVAVVHGYQKEEREVLDEVIDACNRAQAAHVKVAGNALNALAITELATAETALDSALAHMFDRAQASTALHADPHMRQCMQELNAAEGRIGFSRQIYDEAESEYNGARCQFPGSIIAFLFGFKAAGVLRE